MLLIGSILLGFTTTIFEFWPGVIALFAASLALGLGAFLYRQPLFVLAAAGLLAAPYTLAAVKLLEGTPQRLVWVTAAWAGLGLVYLGTAAGLRKLPRYMRWPTLVGQGLGLLTGITLGFIYLLPGTGSSIPTLVSLGVLLGFYLVSAILHDSGKHPALSTWLKFFPVSVENALFLYPIGVLIPAGVYVAWMGSVLVPAWLGAALAGLALGYIGLGQLLARRQQHYRFPFHLLGYLVGVLGVLAAAQNDLALMTTLYINVLFLIAAAVLYKRPIDTAVAGLLLLLPFQITLDLLRITPHAHALAYALLAGVGFVPVGLWLQKRVKAVPDLDLPILIIGYAVSGYALLVSLLGRFGGFSMDVPWIGMLVPTLLTALYVVSTYFFRKPIFAWAAAAVLPIAYGQGLTLLRIPPDYDAGAWILLGTAYLLGVSLIKRREPAFTWLRGFRLPLRLGAWFLTAFGLLQTVPFTLNALFGNVLVFGSTTLNPVLLAQVLGIGFVVLEAVLARSRWPLFLEPALAYFPVTLVFIGYGQNLFGQELHPAHFGIVWAGLGALHVGAGAILDRVRKQQNQSAQPIPYAHGIYLGGYLLGLLAVFWNILWWQTDTQAAMLWSLGIWVLVAAGSALLTHFNQHLTWREGLALVFSGKPVWKPAERIAQDAFLWLAAWPLPVWVTLLLWQFKVVPAYGYLGYGSTALVFLGLAVWLRRVSRSYAWPLLSAGQFYVAFSLLLSVPLTARFLSGNWRLPEENLVASGFILVQLFGVAYYALSGRVFRKQWIGYFLPYLAAILLFFPYTLGWIAFGSSLFGRPIFQAEFGVAWMGLSLGLLALAYLADRQRLLSSQASRPVSTERMDIQGRWLPGRYAHALYFVGYGLAVFAANWVIGFWGPDAQAAFLWTIGLLISAVSLSALLVHFNLHATWDDWLRLFFGDSTGQLRSAIRGIFLWPAAWLFPVWATVLLWNLRVVQSFGYLGYGVAAIGFLGLAFWLRRVERTYTWPLLSAGQFYIALSLLLSVPLTARFLGGNWSLPEENLVASGFILVQLFGVAYYALSGRVFRKQWIGYFLPYLAAILLFFPYTLGWIAFGSSLFGRPIFQAEFGVAWMGLSLGLLALAYLADRRRLLSSQASSQGTAVRMDIRGRWLPGRYAHALYFVGYGLAVFAANWVIGFWGPDAQAAFLWTIGLLISAVSLSALLVHFNLHATWDDWLRLFFGDLTGQLRSAIRGIFLWPAAWLFPVWATVLLWNLNVFQSFGYLGYGLSAIGFLGLAFWLRRVERTYTWPLLSAAHFYTALGLAISARLSGLLLSGWGLASGTTGALGFILLQSAAVLFYAGSSRYFRRTRIPARFFAYIATLLTFVPYTLGWIVYWPEPLGARFAYPWMVWAVLLLGTGFGLDWAERRKHLRSEAVEPLQPSAGRAQASERAQPALRRVGYAHGPFLGGYLLGFIALIRSWGDPLVDLYTLAAALLVAVISQGAVHYGWHDTFIDFVNYFWRRRDSAVRRVFHTGFLFLAAYGFPVWLAKALAYNDVTLAWRGLALALVAPLYIALGLAARRARPEYTWPLYSAGYALTAVGAMVSFENQLLATYVLSLNAVVYGVSAYIFRQSAWLYLSTALVPIIGLMTLDNALNALPAEWVAGMFMGLAFVYIVIGRVFDWRTAAAKLRSGISTYAVAFYAPGFLLSALALAVASVQRELAIGIYLAGVLLYGLCAWSFREALFLYPTVWLTAVPTYLGLTYTRLDPNWYGLGWLPLIAAAILIGRFVFDRPPRERLKLSGHLSHPRMPFYLLGYALSLSMLFIARFDMAALTAAWLAAAGIYLGSTWLFRHPGWLYPGLAALHLGLITYFAIDPAGSPPGYLALPLHVLTWLVALLGGVLWRAGNRPDPIQMRARYRLWALPFVLFAGLDLVVWQAVALVGPDTGVILAGGQMVLLGVLAMYLVKRPLAWGGLGFLTLGIALRLYWLGQPLPILAAVLAGAGFGLYLAGRLIETLVDRLEEAGVQKTGWAVGLVLWGIPLTWLGIGLNAVGAIATLFTPLSYTSQTAAGLAFAGALYLAVAYRGHYYRLGYAAIAALEMAFVLVLIRWDIREPQWYAIPAGLYFTGVGVFERRQGRRRFALLVESFGLMVLLLTSFIQSLNLETGFVYFLLLLVEGLLVAGWGAQQHRKIPFLIGLSASVFNVIGQVLVLLLGGSLLIRWLIFGGVGLLLLIAAIFAERWIIPRAQDLRERLEAWA